eukprot:2119636-Amphidinium_carterae.1
MATRSSATEPADRRYLFEPMRPPFEYGQNQASPPLQQPSNTAQGGMTVDLQGMEQPSTASNKECIARQEYSSFSFCELLLHTQGVADATITLPSIVAAKHCFSKRKPQQRLFLGYP